MASPHPESQPFAGTSSGLQITRSSYLTALLLLIGPFTSVLPALDTLQVTSPDPFLDPRRWTTFDARSGLAGRVFDLIEDRDGHIWFATDRGAQRYDGTHWLTYTHQDGLSDDVVLRLCQAQDGALWFGTPKGLSRFDGDTWTRYGTAALFPGREEPLRLADRFGDLFPARDGTLWVGMNIETKEKEYRGIITRYNGTTWEAIPAPEDGSLPFISSLYQTADGAIWFMTAKGVWRLGDGVWTHYTKADGLAGNFVRRMLEAADGTLWFACNSISISRFDGTNWQTYTHPDSLPPEPAGLIRFRRMFSQLGDEVYRGIPTRQGAVWFMSGNSRAVERYDPHAGATAYSHPWGLVGGYQAVDGSVWFHTGRGQNKWDGLGDLFYQEGGRDAVRERAVRYKDGLWTGYGGADGFLDGAVFGMAQTKDGALWFIGTHRGQAGVAHYDGTGWRRYTTQDGLIDRLYPPWASDVYNHRTLLEARDGALWFVGQHQGRAAVCRFDGAGWRRYTQVDGLVDDWVHLAYETTDGRFWFATTVKLKNNAYIGRRLLSYDGQIWQQHTEADGLSSGRISDMVEWPTGTLWVGTAAGISRLVLAGSSDKAAWWSKTDFPVGWPKVRSLVGTPEALWFAFMPTREGGVGRYDGQQWTYFRTEEGLAGDRVANLYRAGDGALWSAGRAGLTHFDGTSWRRYTKADGLALGAFFPTLRPTRDGRLWIDNSDGKVLHFHPPLGRDPPETELVSPIEQVASAGNVLLHWSGRDRWDETRPQDLEFQWQLDETPWSAWSARTDTTYIKLPGGSYRFAVRARDRHGNVDPTPAVHTFVVDLPWWKNRWLLTSLSLLLGLVAVQTGRVVRRGRHLRQEIAARTRVDAQLAQLSYLQRLRTGLETARSADEMIDAAGRILLDVLTETGHIRIYHNGHTQEFGRAEPVSQTTYRRSLAWGGNTRGHLEVFSPVQLSASQERALLDETTAQLSQALEARELELQLQQSSRLIALGQMAAGVVHELAQPLSVVSTTAGDISQRHHEGLELPPQRLQAMMEDILAMVDRLEVTIDQLRQFSRGDTSDDPGSLVSVNEALKTSLNLIGTQLTSDGITVTQDLAADLPPVWGHPYRLERVFINLLSNARDALDEKIGDTFVEEKKQIIIRTSYQTEGALPVLVEIEDNGIGMDEETRNNLFIPFFTTKGAGRGTGLGLSISYTIVHNHNGQLSCESRKGAGTIFRLALPKAVTSSP